MAASAARELVDLFAVVATQLGELCGQRADNVAVGVCVDRWRWWRLALLLGAEVLDPTAQFGVAVEEVDRAAGGAADAAEGDRLAVLDHRAQRGLGALGGRLALSLRSGAQVLRVSARHGSVVLPGAGAADRLGLGLLVGDGDDDLAQRLLFFAPLGEPDVLVSHLAAGPGLERLLAGVDQLADEVELLLMLG